MTTIAPPRLVPTQAYAQERVQSDARPNARGDGVWAKSSLRERLQWVGAFRRLLLAETERLARCASEEVHKPHWEAVTCDILPLVSCCRWHERHASKCLRPSRLAGTPWWMFGQRHTIERAPLGRVGIIATWNYPIQLLGVQMVQALVAGNDVVIKPSEHAHRTQALLADLAVRAGLPDGALALRDPSIESGRTMVTEGAFDHILFTGSTRVGREIAQHAARTMTPTTLELSGSDSALVLDDADPALAARAIWHAVTMNGGQTCMAPRRAYVDAKIYVQLLSALSSLAAGVRPARLISADAAERVYHLARQTVAAGGRSLTGVLEAPIGPSIRPLAIVDCPPDAPLAIDEHFGPALAVIPCSSTHDMFQLHARHDQVLATSVFTRSPARGRALATALGTGSVTINDCVLPTAHPGAPLSGRRASGWGVSRGAEGLLALTRPLHISTTSPTMRAPTEAPVGRAAARLQSLLLRMASW